MQNISAIKRDRKKNLSDSIYKYWTWILGMAVIPKFWYEPGRIPSILEGFIPGWKESFQDGRNPSGVEIHILSPLWGKPGSEGWRKTNRYQICLHSVLLQWMNLVQRTCVRVCVCTCVRDIFQMDIENEQASRQASTRKAFSQSHALDGLVLFG